MIGKCRFDSHTLRHLHDFVRQPTIFDYFVRDARCWASTVARGAIMQEH